MNTIIVNNSKIRNTANGQSVVEGSYARVLAIKGKSIFSNANNTIQAQDSTFQGIKSYNRNLFPAKTINSTTYGVNGLYELPADIIELIKNSNFSHLIVSQKYILLENLENVGLKLKATVVYNDKTIQTVVDNRQVYENIYTKRTVNLPLKNKENIQSIKIEFNGNDSFVEISPYISWLSTENQIELGEKETRYTEQKNSEYLLESSITLRSCGEIADTVYPHSNIYIEKVDKTNIEWNKLSITSTDTFVRFTYSSFTKNINYGVSNPIYFFGNDKLNKELKFYHRNSSNKPTSGIYYTNENSSGVESTSYFSIISYDTTVKTIDDLKSHFLITDSITPITYVLPTPIVRNLDGVFHGYQVFNNGYERILGSHIDINNVAPEIITEYISEIKQGADSSRFDFFMIDGESFCGIGYEMLKTTNQITYKDEPSRQDDGSMLNIEDYSSFVVGAGDIGFSLIDEETFRRLRRALMSKKTFYITYYDPDFDRVLTRNMYAKPSELQNFLSYGDEIIGIRNLTISFVATMNETQKYTVSYFSNEGELIGKSQECLFGRSVTTPELPKDQGYNYWLSIENGFGTNKQIKVKGKKSILIFGDTKFIAVK